MSFLTLLQGIRIAGQKWLAVLIDPDKVEPGHDLDRLVKEVDQVAQAILVGGSLMSSHHLEAVVKTIKANTRLPIVLFPGSGHQLTGEADALLFLSLISGRNPELLIGEHVRSAPIIKKLDIPTVATGYMLVESGVCTTAQYVSQTQPIPRAKPDIAATTAMAGEMLGLEVVYLDGGSGADLPVPAEMIVAVRKAVELPIIVGGGIRNKEGIENAWQAGADMVVVGTAIENDPALLADLKHDVLSR